MKKSAIQFFFKTVSNVSPKLGGRLAFKLFQKVRNKKIRAQEEGFYTKAKHFKIPMPLEDLNCYELGSPTGKPIFLVHGWDSNAGSMSNFAFHLAKQDYRVLSFDLPSHASSKKGYTNLFECKEAMRTLLEFIDPKEPVSVIAHSLGSAMSAFALSELKYPVDKLVFLSLPNQIVAFFNDFKEFIGLSKKSYENMLARASRVMNEDIRSIFVQEKLKNISFNKSIIIHDRFDKVLPFRHAEEVSSSSTEIVLRPYEKIGHYRMLWNQDVLQETLLFINS